MCSNAWSIAARARSGCRQRRFGHEISSKRRRHPTRRRPTAPTTSATSKARSEPASREPTTPGSASARRSRNRADSSEGSACRAISNAPPWTRRAAGSVILEKSGDFTVLIGTQSNGQGHETAYAQVVSQWLDVPLSRVQVVQGDTDRVASGGGTGGSRSIPVGAVMVDRASRKLAASAQGPRRRQARSLGPGPRDRRGMHPHRRHRPLHFLRGARRAASSHAGKADRDRKFCCAPGDLSEWNSSLRGRDRFRHRPRAHCPLRRRRRLRLHPQSFAARGPSARRDRAGRRSGADGRARSTTRTASS